MSYFTVLCITASAENGEVYNDVLFTTVWEKVKLLSGGVFAAYVVQNNEMCSIAYVPDQDWVPAILRDMMKSFID